MAAKGWSWKLVVLPVLSVAVLAVVLLYGAGVLDVTSLGPGVRVFHVVLAGIALLLVLLAIETVMLVRTFLREGPVELDEDPAVAAPPEPDEEPFAPAPAAPLPAPPSEGLEAILTADQYDGRHVIEVARPPKSAVEGGIYATTYVPVNGAFTLRLEELVAVHERA